MRGGLQILRKLLASAFAILAAASAAADRTDLKVRLTTTPNGMTARFEATHPIDTLALAYDSGDVRKQTWTLPDGFVLQETVIARVDGAPFDAVEVAIRPRNEPTDATYPCLFAIGPDGFGFYAGCFVGNESDFKNTIEVAPTSGQIVAGLPLGRSVWPVDAAFGHNLAHRYAYVGPASYLYETANTQIVVPPDFPQDIARDIRTKLDRTIALYARATRHALAGKPLALIAENRAMPGHGIQGDTTNGPAVALRFFGSKSADNKTAQSTDHLIAHETAHFWNTDSFHPTPGSPAWLWEGGAEYWALTAQKKLGWISAEERRKKLESALNECTASLNRRPLAAARSMTTYVCGQTVMWLADIFEKKRTTGRGDIFRVWQRVFRTAEQNGGLYDIVGLLHEASKNEGAAERALAVFLTDTGNERWSRLPDLLRPFRVRVNAIAPTADALRWTAVSHLLDLYCTGSRGAWHEADYLKLDTGDRCGPLNGDPEVDTLNGLSLYTNAAAAFAAAAAACGTGGDIILTRTGKPDTLIARCTKPLPPPPPEFRIVATP